MKQKLLKLQILSLLGACGGQNIPVDEVDSNQLSNVIYGEDSRRDLYQLTDAATLALADATVALVKSSDIRSRGAADVELLSTTIGENYNLCKDEPFRDQKNPAFCSGFLVGPNVMVTAGHCIQNQSQCNDTRFVFGFAVKTKDSDPTSRPLSEVYSCREIIHTQQDNDGADYAVVRLDRNVVGHSPLRIRRQGQITPATAVTVIGHPSGLPTKTATGTVRTHEGDYFITNLDTYGGNSGSGVFNSSNGDIEGILVRGEDDYDSVGSCQRSKHCTETGCRGEDVTSISKALVFIDQANNQPDDEPGQPIEPENPFSADVVVNKAIPDNKTSGIQSTLQVPQSAKGKTVQVMVRITHSFIADLVVRLKAPNGKTIYLHRQSGGSADNIVGTYGVNLTSQDSLDILADSNAGAWTLNVSDRAAIDVGRLESWGLRIK